MVTKAVTFLKQVLNDYDLIDFDSTKAINSAGNYLLFDGLQKDKAINVLCNFSLYVVISSTKHDTNIYSIMDAMYSKVLEAAGVDEKIKISQISLTAVDDGLFFYRIQIQVKEKYEKISSN